MTDADTLVGTTFADGYEMLSVLGRGGLSVVYKARYVPLDQLVAVKVLQAHMAQNQTVVQRLRLEAKVARSLEHPNIVRVLRLHISEDGFPFLVADYVDGRTMQEALAEDGPFSETRFLHVIMQVLAALEHAHARNIVHRDIKPSNIMLTQVSDDPDFVKVVDFGIAKLLADSSSAITQNASQSSSANLFGSPSYMSPEQGTGVGVDARSDIYSLGCVMYELLTGVTAFTGETALDTLYQHTHFMPPPFREAAPDRQISPTLESAVFAALQKKPGDRPQSVDDLRLMLAGKPARWRAPVGKRRLKRQHLVGGAVALAALGIGVGAFCWQKLGDPIATTGGEESMPTNVSRAQTEIKLLSLCTTPYSALAVGERLAKMQDKADAYIAFTKANSLITQQTAPSLSLEIKTHMIDLGLQLGKAKEVYPEAKEAVRIAPSVGLLEHGLARNGFARTLHELHRDNEALSESQAACRLADEALRKNEKPGVNYHVHCGSLYGEQAAYYVMLNRRPEAEKLLRTSVMHHTLAKDIGLLMQSERALASYLVQEQKGREALVEMQKWLKLTSQVEKPYDDNMIGELASGYETLGYARMACGDRTGAHKAVAHSVALARQVPDGGEALAARMHAQAHLFYLCDQVEEGDDIRRQRLAYQSAHPIDPYNAGQYELMETNDRASAMLRRASAKKH